jgi:hypothetical protein
MAGTRDASTEGMKAGGYYDAHSEYQRRVNDGGDELLRAAVAALELRGPAAGRLRVEAERVDEVASPYWEAFECDGDAAAYADSYTAFVRAFSESTLVDHLFEPGRTDRSAAALADEYFDRFRCATAADPAAGRYEAWVVRVVFARR